MAEKKLDIKIVKADGIGGFGAWLAGHQKENGKGIILLNVEAHFKDGALFDEDGNIKTLDSDEKKRFLIETLTHEFAHALEEFFEMEFDEDFVEAVSTSYDGEYEIADELHIPN